MPIDLLQTSAGFREGSHEYKTCKTELVPGEREGERLKMSSGDQENSQLNTKHKRHSFCYDALLLWTLDQS